MKEYKIAITIEDIEQYIRSSDVVSIDIETSPKDEYREEELAALDAHKATITGISLSVKKDTGIYIPLRHKVGKNANIDEIMQYMKTLLQSKDKTIVIHNAVFESMFFYAQGIVITSKVYDTIVASQLTLKNSDEFRELSDSGLKTLVPHLYKQEMPTFMETVGEGYFDKLDSEAEKTIRYACADADYALQLRETFNTWFDNNMPKHRWIVENMESGVAVYTGMMKYNGLDVNVELMKQKQQEAHEKIEELRRKIQYVIGDVDIGGNAMTQNFKDYLFKTLGLPVVKTTQKFTTAADDEAMQLLIAYCKENRAELVEMLENVQEYRKWTKIKSTYIDGYLKFVSSATGRIHPDLLPLATNTGRFASRKPNMQNMPRKGNDPIGIRNFIRASEGKTFLDYDFSQIELRVGAFYCKDEKMIETYKQGGDIHAQTTSVIYNIPLGEAEDKNVDEYKERRTIAKNCNFGVFFGLFAKGLQRTLKFKAGVEKSVGECTKIIDNLKNGYPKLKEWQANTIADARKKRYTETFFGRRRILSGINNAEFGVRSFNERCALNTPIQGTAADILKLSMCRLLKDLADKPYIKPLLQVHDELLFEVDIDKIEEAKQAIINAMEQKPFDEFDVPIVAEGAIGQTFGGMQEL